MVSHAGFEPATLWLKVRCSTNWANDSSRFTKNGADERTWTPNLLITSQLLYQLSYIGVLWWRMTGSNRRPSACKADALPAELILHCMPGDVLLSQEENLQLPSALRSLTSVFGMGTGVTFSLSPPDFLKTSIIITYLISFCNTFFKVFFKEFIPWKLDYVVRRKNE